MPKSTLQRQLIQQAVTDELGLLALDGGDPQMLADYAVKVVAEALAAPMASVFRVERRAIGPAVERCMVGGRWSKDLTSCG